MITAFVSIDQLDRITVHRGTQASGVGGQVVETTVPTASSILAQLEKLSAGMAEKNYGKQTKVKWRALLSASVDVQENDLIEVLNGRYIGTIVEVDSVTIPLRQLKLVAMRDTKRSPS